MNTVYQHIRRTILAGIFTAAPIALTYYILNLIFNILEKPTAKLLRQFDIVIPGLGIIITITVIYLLGLIVTNVLGRKIFDLGERLVKSIPIVRSIYNNIKQITQAFTGTGTGTFRSVVYIEYPRRETWTLAFVTGESVNRNGREYYHLFVPTTPNPTSGFFIMIPKSDTLPANMNVENGLKTIISGGMLAPKEHSVGSSFLEEKKS